MGPAGRRGSQVSEECLLYAGGRAVGVGGETGGMKSMPVCPPAGETFVAECLSSDLFI